MNNADLQQLKALAMAANTHSDTIGEPEWYSTDENMAIFPPDPDLSLIAACTPKTILILIERIESLAADAERYKWLRDHGCISAPVKAADMSYDPPEWTDSAVDACMDKEQA